MNSESGSGDKALYFVLGAFVGAATALLLAPRSGEETRKYLAGKTRERVDYLSKQGRDLADKATSYVEKGKGYVEQQRDQLTAAFEAGKQAYKEEKVKAKS